MAKIRDTSEEIIKTILVTSRLNALDDRSVRKTNKQLMVLNSIKGTIEARIEQTAMEKTEIVIVSVAEAESVVTLVEIDITPVSVMTGRNTKMKKLIERAILTQEHK